MAFSVSAVDANSNEFVDFNDYAEYEFAEDNSSVTVEVNFPSEWNNTYIDFGDTGLGGGWYTGNTIYLDGVAGSWSKMRMYPISGNMDINIDVGSQVSNSHILDLRYLPDNATLTYEFSAGISNDYTDISDQVFARYFLFVDSSGYIFARNRYYFYPESTGYGDYYWSETVNVSDFPDEAVGLIPHFLMRNIDSHFDSVKIELSSFEFVIPMTGLEFQASQNEQMKATIDNIESALEAQDKKLDELPGQIGDEMQNVMDNEKEQANDEGNKFVDQILSALPDPSQGVLSALGELTASVGYTGTEAIIPIPKIVIPAIGGLFDEIVLYEGSELDIGEYLYFIPEGLLTVIRSLFTIAIVFYCVYELKGIISYVFTLKENGRS